jgi:hypothetical protein
MRSRRVTGLVARSRATLADLRDLWDRFRRRSPRPRAFRPNGWTIAEVERAIRNQPVEWAYVFDQNGNQIVRRRGTRRTLFFGTSEVPLLKDATVVHNHPIDDETPAEAMTFSSLDIVFAIRHDLAESRVVAGDWRFTVQRPADGWPVDEDVVLAVYNELLLGVNDEFVVAIAEGRITERERRARLYDETIRRIAGWGQFTYHRARLE